MIDNPDYIAAVRAQHQAANPAASRLASANAGSGKTRVLVDRVSRILLQDVPPEKILCLTYTKAAASEMQSRLFEKLGKWSIHCLLYTSPSPRDATLSRMPSSA